MKSSIFPGFHPREADAALSRYPNQKYLKQQSGTWIEFKKSINILLLITETSNIMYWEFYYRPSEILSAPGSMYSMVYAWASLSLSFAPTPCTLFLSKIILSEKKRKEKKELS